MKSTVADFHTRVICLRIVPVTGSTIRLTHYPRDLVMSNSEVYLSTAGYDFTAYSSAGGLSASMVDFEGIAGLAGIGYDEISSGSFDNARAYLFATSFAAPVEDEEELVASILGKATLMDDRYKFEEMALIDVLGQSVGSTYTTTCPKRFGGTGYAGCGVALGPITVTGALTSVTSNSVFRDNTRAETLDYFGLGTIAFTTGDNAGLKPLEIKSYAVNGTIETYEPFHYPPQVGDTYTMIPGCRKRLQDCKNKWTNIENFGGFTRIPTSPQYAQVGTK